MKAYITKYALTSGIREVETEQYPDTPHYISWEEEGASNRIKTMNNTELKACPFCGAAVRLSRPFCPQEIVLIKCENPICEINPEVRTSPAELAIELWNIRAGGRKPAMSKTGGAKGVGMSDLLDGE